MSYVERRSDRHASVALTVALHTCLLLLLLSQRLALPATDAPQSLLRLSLLPLPPVPPPELPPPPVEARETGPVAKASARPSRAPVRVPAPAGGGAPPVMLDRSAMVLPNDLPQVPAGTGISAGSGIGAGQGDGMGNGRGGGNGSGDGGAGAGTPSEMLFAEWIVKPDDQLPRYFPREASMRRISGQVMLTCLVDRQNRARLCKIVNETPRHHDFGRAALRLSRLFRIKPPTVDGAPRHDVRVRVPVFFDKPKPLRVSASPETIRKTADAAVAPAPSSPGGAIVTPPSPPPPEPAAADDP